MGSLEQQWERIHSVPPEALSSEQSLPYTAGHLPRFCVLPRGWEAGTQLSTGRLHQHRQEPVERDRLLPDVIGDSLGPPDRDLSVPSGSTWHQQSEMGGAREAQRAGAQLLAHAGKELFHILNVRRPGQVVRLHEAIILIHQLCESQALSSPVFTY